ncbi:hypothetical protein GXP67_24855 [Rhodocytophaga rosea]|uniref:Uncharacterized protein n=1 Tax=Rhodocytophaga rosea TaxID=2704465 RepID=A0A6C0GNY6_9BACT|nr:hypothetical protein [Rhodocytophaga rosea]QHT69647.1 hypothetical protein GXP67_24855 [Rhodocytophaga rosea]
MKKKISYCLLGVLLFAGLYVWLRVSFGLFTPYNSWTARQDLKKGKVQYIAIGLPVMPQVRNQVAQQYEFEYNYVGCVVTTELLNGSEYYNQEVKAYLEKKYGEGMWENIKRKCDSLIAANAIDK